MRGLDPHEHAAPLRRGGSPTAQVAGDSLTHVRGQRESLGPVALAPHKNLTGTPVDVVQPQDGDLTGAQPEPGQQQQHRVVASPDCTATVTYSQQTPYLLGFERLWQARQLPSRHRRDRTGQRRRNPALDVQVVQQRSQRGHDHLRRPIRPDRTRRHHEPDDIACGQPSKIQPVPVAPAVQELPHRSHVACSRRGCQSALDDEEPTKLLQQLLRRIENHRWRRRQHPNGAR